MSIQKRYVITYICDNCGEKEILELSKNEAQQVTDNRMRDFGWSIGGKVMCPNCVSEYEWNWRRKSSAEKTRWRKREQRDLSTDVEEIVKRLSEPDEFGKIKDYFDAGRAVKLVEFTNNQQVIMDSWYNEKLSADVIACWIPQQATYTPKEDDAYIDLREEMLCTNSWTKNISKSMILAKIFLQNARK